MQALVHDLVQTALSDHTSVSQLLRLALVTARRLDQPHIAQWISQEMNGYTSAQNVPSYRHILNLAHAQDASSVTLLQPAAILEELVTSAKTVTVPSREGININLSATQIQPVTEALRNVLLQWGLALEKNGLKGENGTFTDEEKNMAQQLSQQFFQSRAKAPTPSKNSEDEVFPVVPTLSYNQDSLKKIILALEKELQNPSLDQHLKTELQAALTALEAQSSLTKPKWPVIHAIHTSLKDIADTSVQLVPYLAELFPL